MEEVRVLVVDDEADSAATLALVLEMDGYVVRTASSGQEAIALAASFHPLCVLMDIHMVGLDGHETCARLRERHGDELVLIAVTGAGSAEDRISDSFSRFDHYLRKPVDLRALRALLPPMSA